MLKVFQRIRKTPRGASTSSLQPDGGADQSSSSYASSHSNSKPPQKSSKSFDKQEEESSNNNPAHEEDMALESKTINISLDHKQSQGEEPPAKIMIAGGGIIGLLMALAIDEYLNVKADIYDQAMGFDPDVGAGMGLYANGLRVIQDIDPTLLKEIRNAGHPYVYRRWERHDGTEVAVANESVLGVGGNCTTATTGEEEKDKESDGLQTMGIRRWKLQQALQAAVKKRGIPIHFNKQVLTVNTPENGTTEVVFTDGSKRQTRLLIGADGGRSAVRTALLQKTPTASVTNQQEQKTQRMPTLHYTGVTCIMGVSQNVDNQRQGISFPVSNTTQCHGVFYPTGGNEQCFQFHFPTEATKSKKKGGNTCVGNKNNGEEEDSCWGNLSQQVSREECSKLADLLEMDGWDEEKYLKPLREVTRAVRVGFCQLTPSLKRWSFPNAKGQIGTILVGDAAHPPVPYIGQGAQQGMEDVGTLALLFKSFCLDDQGQFDLHNLDYAVKVYEKLRIPRVETVLSNARTMGEMQQKRAQSPKYNIIKEEIIQRDVFFHETMPIMFPGALYDYRDALEKELKQMTAQHNGPPLRSIAE